MKALIRAWQRVLDVFRYLEFRRRRAAQIRRAREKDPNNYPLW
jgi:hypothetical protein